MRPSFHRRGICALAALAVLLAGCGVAIAPEEEAAEAPSRAEAEAGAPSSAHGDDHLVALVAGEAIERRIAGGERHRYALELEAGLLVEIVAEQLGADVVLELFAPEGDSLIAVDGPSGASGREELLAVSRDAGRHHLEVRAFGRETAGRYRLRLAPPRPATAEDRRRAEAATELAAGEALRLEGELAAAVERFGSALDGFERLGEAARAGEALDRLARLAERRGALGEAIVLQEQAVERLDAAPPDRRGAALSRLGLLRFRRDELDAAIAAWERALPLAEASGDAATVGRLWHNLGHARQRLGDLQAALDAYAAALPLRRGADARGEAETLHNLGVLEAQLGQSRRARRWLERAAERWRALGDPLALARTLDRLGLLELAAGEADLAAERFERALELRGETGNPAVSLGNLGLARRHQERPGEAWKLQRRALGLVEARGDRLAEARTRENLGHLERDLGRSRAALAEHRRALELYRAIEDPAGEASALAALALDHRALGDLESARAAIERSIELGEASRELLVAGELRISFLASVEERYDLAVELLVEQARAEPDGGWDRRALAASERARARSLRETLAAPSLAAPGSALERRERELTARLAAATRRRTAILASRSANVETRASAELAIEELARELSTVRGRLRRGSAAPSRPIAAEQLHRWLAPGELLLELRLGRETSELWALAADGTLELHRLPPAAELEPLARRAEELLARSHRREARGALRPALCALSEALLAPVAARLGDHRLVVVADGALAALPFAALPDPRHPCAEAPPLAAAQPLVSLPALSLRATAAERPRRDARGIAVLADPIFSPGDPRLAGDQASRTAPRASPGELPRLPATRREAEALVALAGERRAPLLALGAAARKELLTGGELAGRRWLHLATHALVDERRPELSTLVLSRFDERGRRVDGDLGLYEVAGLDLAAELVTLSACRSARGREVPGEGVVGFAGAFLEAGARSTLVSLWDVSDESTAALMEHFYRALYARDLSPAEALHAAQLELLADPQRSAPYHWAAFILFG